MKILVLSLLLTGLLLVPAYASSLPTLKMLSTPSCPACVQMSKVLDQLNAQYEGKLATEKVDVYEQPEIAQKYNVRYVPHLLFLDAEGKVVEQKVGYLSLEDVLKTFKASGIEIH
ncbi:MAG: thioredoxin family protein [Fretibacterium sp.]|nr:thioredoxin family protein [Fretibacterium sp.]